MVAVEVMIANSRVQELIRENKPEYIPEAISEGGFFEMQTMTQALIKLVIAGEVDEEVAKAAAPNSHDFSIALARASKEHSLKLAAAEEELPEDDQPAVAVVPQAQADGLRLI